MPLVRRRVIGPGHLNPGFHREGSLIQRARFSGVFSSMPAAMVERLPIRVRLGPMIPGAAVPWMAWQRTQVVSLKKTCRPRATRGSSAAMVAPPVEPPGRWDPRPVWPPPPTVPSAMPLGHHLRCVGRGSRGLPVRDPGLELLLALGHHPNAHEGVGLATELGALSPEHTLFLDGEVHPVPLAFFTLRHGHHRVHVPLSTQLGNPEGVDDVPGFQPQAHGPAHGKVKLVGGGDAQLGIVEAPPVPLARNLHHQSVALGRPLDLETHP